MRHGLKSRRVVQLALEDRLEEEGRAELPHPLARPSQLLIGLEVATRVNVMDDIPIDTPRLIDRPRLTLRWNKLKYAEMHEKAAAI